MSSGKGGGGAAVCSPLALILLICAAVVGPAVMLGSEAAMVGGYSNASASSPAVQKAAEFAFKRIEQSSNSLYSLKLVRVLKAQTQVVAGVNYKLSLRIGTTNCYVAGHAGAARNPARCRVTDLQTCNVVVFEQVWTNTTQLTGEPQCGAKTAARPRPRTNVGAGSGRSKRQIGGAVPADVSSELVRGATEFVVRELETESNGIYSLQLGEIREATRQLVSGLRITVTFNVQLSSCVERHSLLADCPPALVRHESAVCSAAVWDQAWRVPRYQLISHSCDLPPPSLLSSPLPSSPLLFKTNKTPKSFNQIPSLLDDTSSDKKKIGVGKKRIGMSYADFESFKERFARKYETLAEETKRYNIFKDNMRRAQFVQDHDLGTAEYGATKFADLTRDEFSAYISKKPWNKATDPRMTVAKIPGGAPPSAFDWRTHGAVSEVKNQGSCGSCWAFSVTGNIEGQWAIKKNKLIPLSEQELVDCDKLDEGCNGGLPSNAYSEIQRIGGLETETDYPYKGDDEKCVFTRDKVKVYINGSLNISSNEAEMAAWLAQNGPMSIGINAFAMQFYFGGISHPWKLFCPDALDHGVVIVGYDVHHGFFGDTPYWIVKNSWGSNWGEKGYYYVYRGDGTCGLNEMVSSAIVD